MNSDLHLSDMFKKMNMSESPKIRLTKEILEYVFEYKGVVFGGFVRDYMIQNIPFNDIDVFFTNKLFFDDFIKTITERYHNIFIYKRHEKYEKKPWAFNYEVNTNYTFVTDRTRLFIPLTEDMDQHDKSKWLHIDIVYHPSRGNDDINVNSLMFDGTDIKVMENSYFNYFPVESIINSIHNKQALMNSEFPIEEIIPHELYGKYADSESDRLRYVKFRQFKERFSHWKINITWKK